MTPATSGENEVRDISGASDWRYDIQYGPEGEANYAWVYDETGKMVGTVQTYQAEKIVRGMNRRSAGLGTVSVKPLLTETMRAEVIYEGEDNSWLFKLSEVGNRDGVHYDRSIELSADSFPEGTVISIREPATPEAAS